MNHRLQTNDACIVNNREELQRLCDAADAAGVPIPPFDWKTDPALADGQHYCQWRGLWLWADMFGGWEVNQEHEHGRVQRIVTSETQTPGADLEDAKRRAQAAAMSLVQRNQPE